MKYLIIFAFLILPLTGSAATFFYVDTEGNLASLNAPDAQTALALAGEPSSGVILDLGEVTPGMVDSTVVKVVEKIQKDIPLVFDRPSVQTWSGASLYVPHIPTMNWNGLMPGSWGSLPW